MHHVGRREYIPSGFSAAVITQRMARFRDGCWMNQASCEHGCCFFPPFHPTVLGIVMS